MGETELCHHDYSNAFLLPDLVVSVFFFFGDFGRNRKAI